MGLIKNIVRGTTRNVTITITENGSNPDITGDTVTITAKRNENDSDSEALFQNNADVTTSGASGIAIIAISATDSDVEPGEIFYDIIWVKSGGEKFPIVECDSFFIKKRVSDV